jgi:hypothetical protein
MFKPPCLLRVLCVCGGELPTFITLNLKLNHYPAKIGFE